METLQPLIDFSQLLLVAIFILVSVNLYLVFRLKDIDPFAKWNPNGINSRLFLIFWIVGLVAAVLGTMAYSDTFTLMIFPASYHGEEIDRMMYNTMYVMIFVSLLTNTLLFYYGYRYRYKEGKKALYYPHNNRLEVIWTVVPAIVMTALVLDGGFTWNSIMMSDEEDDQVVLEMTGEQFRWTARYPGEDNRLGDAKVSFIGDGNILGLNLEDKWGHDDLIIEAPSEILIPVDKQVMVKIRSKDVLHSMTLAHFRVKMDAVPGLKTQFAFRPKYTTAKMRKMRNDPDFEYEMSCQQICGASHWNMRRVVRVVEQEEYDKWLGEQKKFFAAYLESQGKDIRKMDKPVALNQ